MGDPKNVLFYDSFPFHRRKAAKLLVEEVVKELRNNSR